VTDLATAIAQVQAMADQPVVGEGPEWQAGYAAALSDVLEQLQEPRDEAAEKFARYRGKVRAREGSGAAEGEGEP
jgi:hypothetical protein